MTDSSPQGLPRTLIFAGGIGALILLVLGFAFWPSSQQDAQGSEIGQLIENRLNDMAENDVAVSDIAAQDEGPDANQGGYQGSDPILQSFDTLNNPLLAAVTFAAAEIQATDTAGQQVYRLIDGTYAGVPFDSLRFLVTDLGADRIQISEFSLNGPLSLDTAQGRLIMDWEALNWDGDYDLAVQAYERLDISADGLSLSNEDQTIGITVGQIISTNTLDGAAERSLTSTFNLKDLEASVLIDSVTISYALPEASMNAQTRGYSADENPFVNFGAQLAASLDMVITGTYSGLDPSIMPPLGQEGDLALTIAPSELRLQDFDAVSLQLGQMTVTGQGTGYATPGDGTATYEYSLASIAYDDPATGLTMRSGALNLLFDMQGLDYAYFMGAHTPGADQLTDPAGGTYAGFGDLLAGFAMNMSLSIADQEIKDPSAALDIRIGQQTLDFSLSQDQSQGALSLGVSLNDLALGSVGADGLIASMLPQDAEIRLSLANMELAGLAAILQTLPRSGSIEDEAAFARDLEAAGPILLQWFLGSGAQLEPVISYTSPRLNAAGSGTLPINGDAALALGGNFTLNVQDFAGLRQAIADAAQSDNLADREAANTLNTILLFAPAFGRQDGDGNLISDLTFADDGAPQLNGLRIPGF